MSVNDRQTAKRDGQDKYEAAVLDFLDKEMAAVQPTKKGKEQTEELDALVSDLLKQVITESDQPAGDAAASDEINKLISELAPLSATTPVAEKKAVPTDPFKGASQADNIYTVASAPKAEAAKPAIIKPKVGTASAAKASQTSSGSILATLLSSKNRIPVIAAAAVCLLLAIGIPVYLMRGSSTPATSSVATQPVAAAPAAPVAAAPVTPAPVPAPVATKPAQAPAPVPSSKPSAAELKAAAQAQKQAAQAQKQSTPAAQPAPAPVNVPAPAPQPSPAAAQAAPPVQPPAPAPAPAPEKPAVQIAETITPAPPVLDRTPAPRIASNPAAENSSLDLQTPTATHSVPRVMTAAQQLSQVPPKYPELALRSRASGVVVLDLDIDNTGKVTKATPVSGPDLFYKEAISAVLKWKYKPASVGGSNVPSQSRVTLNFKLPK
jgi:TonB family protein